MKTKLKAPRSVGSTSSAAASTDRSGRAASRLVTIAVSEVASSIRPRSATRLARSVVLTRFPLWANAIVVAAPRPSGPDGVARSVGWAFSHVDPPVVE